jgi:hypothetical protein
MNSSAAPIVLSESLLEALLSPIATTRLAAEAQLSQCTRTERVHGFVTFLLQQSSQQHLQHFVAVLLRREILQLSRQEANDILTPFLMPALWQLFQASSGRLQMALGFCLAECCGHAKDHGISRQILESSLSSFASVSPTALLSLWTAMVERAPSNFVTMNDVLRLYEHCVRLGSTSSCEWINSFLEFLVLMATRLDDESFVLRLGHQYLPALIQELRSRFLQQTIADASSWAWTLQTAALEVPDLLKSSWMDVLDLCHQALHSNTTSSLALENLEYRLSLASLVASIFHIPHVKRVTILATESKAPSLQPVLMAALRTCWQMLLAECPVSTEEEALEPASMQGSTDDDNEDIAHAKEILVDLLRAWPHCAITFLVTLLQESNTQSAIASLQAWQCLVEATPRALGASGFIHATQMALTAQNSPAPSVQYQAVRLLGFLCECPAAENDETAVAPWFPKILEALTCAVHSKETAIVALACRAMVSYIRPPESSSSSRPILRYLPDVIQALVTGPLQARPDDSAIASDYVVQIRAVETLGALAASLSEQSAEAMRPFYAHVMPGLLSYTFVLMQPRVHEYALSRAGASVEAATLWGPADPDAFAGDAERLLPGMVAALERSAMEPIRERLWTACARIATVFPDTVYAPYLGRVLPHLLRRATDPDDVEFTVRLL